MTVARWCVVQTRCLTPVRDGPSPCCADDQAMTQRKLLSFIVLGYTIVAIVRRCTFILYVLCGTLGFSDLPGGTPIVPCLQHESDTGGNCTVNQDAIAKLSLTDGCTL